MQSIWRQLSQMKNSREAGEQLLEQIYLTLQSFFTHERPQTIMNGLAMEKLSLTKDEIQEITKFCSQLQPCHFNLHVPTVKEVQNQRIPPIRYQHVWDNENVSIGIFILQPGACIPLHDHPGMSVVSQLLYGSARIQSYDLVQSISTSTEKITLKSLYPKLKKSKNVRLAQFVGEQIVHALDNTFLEPDNGNLHEICASGDIGCAFFDILAPAYDPDQQRDCTYYREIGERHQIITNDATVNLTALETYIPENLLVVPDVYRGPSVIPD